MEGAIQVSKCNKNISRIDNVLLILPRSKIQEFHFLNGASGCCVMQSAVKVNKWEQEPATVIIWLQQTTRPANTVRTVIYNFIWLLLIKKSSVTRYITLSIYVANDSSTSLVFRQSCWFSSLPRTTVSKRNCQYNDRNVSESDILEFTHLNLKWKVQK